MSRIEEIKERLSKIDPNMMIYKCDSGSMDKDDACGIYEGQSLDCSYDECHHPLSHDLAEYIVKTPADLEYLLTKLEQAERAFEKILSEEGRKIWKDKDLAPIYREIAIIALKQIRS